MKTRAVLLLILVSLPLGATVHGQDNAVELVNKVTQVYSNLKKYHFERLTLTETKTEFDRVKSETRAEQIHTSASDGAGRKRLEVISPQLSIVVVSDGSNTWSYLPAFKQYAKNGTGELPPLFARLPDQAERMLSSYGRLNQLAKEVKYVREEAVDIGGHSTPCYVISVTYPSSPMDIEPPRATLWIDKSKYLVLRESLTTKHKGPFGTVSATRTTHTFTIAKANESISDGVFAFSPPNEAKEVAELNLPGLSGPGPAKELAGKDAIDFSLKDLEGTQVSLKDLRGKVVLMNFWASWCGPCRIEMPHLEKLHNEFKDKGLVVLGINDESADIARQYLTKNKFTFNSLVDDKREVGKSYGVSAIPQVIVVGRDGKVLAHHIGARSENELREAVKKAGIGVR